MRLASRVVVLAELLRQRQQVVCLSVRPSVSPLRYRGHIGCNSSKIISRLVNPLSANPNISDLLVQRNTQKF